MLASLQRTFIEPHVATDATVRTMTTISAGMTSATISNEVIDAVSRA